MSRYVHKMPILALFWLIMLALTVGAQFSGVRSKVERTGPKLASKPKDCKIEIIDKEKPERPHEEIARIEVFVRRNKITQGREAVYEEAVPELRKQACKLGADAVVVLRQRVSHSGEFKLLYVKTIAIRYTGEQGADAGAVSGGTGP